MFHGRVDRSGNLISELLFVFHLIGEIFKIYGREDGAGVFIFPGQQFQKGGLSLAVPADKTQLPVRVDLERDIFKDRIETVLVCETQIFNLYQ